MNITTGKKRNRNALNEHALCISLAKYSKTDNSTNIVEAKNISTTGIELGSLVRHKSAPKGTAGIVLACDEATNFATVYHPAPDEITVERMDHLVSDADTDSTFRHGFIGQFQTTLVYNATLSSDQRFYMAECNVLSKENIDNLKAKNVQFIRNTCLRNGLVPIVRQITDVSTELCQVTIVFDILVAGAHRHAPLLLMSKLLRTRNTIHVIDIMRNQLRFGQLHDKRTWDVDSLMKLSESLSCKRDVPLFTDKNRNDDNDNNPWPNQLSLVDKMTESENRSHGIARCFWFPIPTDSNSDGVSYHYSPFFDSVINSQQLSDVRGGILADETSMGKTRGVAQFLKSRLDKLSSTSSNVEESNETTLIVVATNRMQKHWAIELAKVGLSCRDALGKTIEIGHAHNHRRHHAQQHKHKHHDTSSRESKTSSAISIVTMSTFYSMQNINSFYRVIVDDAHITMFGRDGALAWWSRIQSTCRWIVTHSPVQKTIMDMEPILSLFSIPGFDIEYWRNVKQELGHAGCGPFTRPASEFVALFVAFSNLMQRSPDPGWKLSHLVDTRTRAATNNFRADTLVTETRRLSMSISRDDAFVQVVAILIPFRSRVQGELYKTEANNLRQRLSCSSCNTMPKSWSTYKAHIQRIRRLCSFQSMARTRLQTECPCSAHGEWWKQEADLEKEMRDEIKSSQTLASASKVALQSRDDACPICYQLTTRPRQTPCCNHVFCLPCIKAWLSNPDHDSCPLCRKTLSLTRLVKPLFETKSDDNDTKKCLDIDMQQTKSETKSDAVNRKDDMIHATMNSKIPEMLRRIRTREKTVIVSQFHSSLLHLAHHIQGHDTGFVRAKRPCGIIMHHDSSDPLFQAFQHGSLNILLVLFKADSTFALPNNVERVYLMEPCLDALAERRLIGRLMNNTRSPRLKTVEYLVMKDTIEQAIWEWNYKQLQTSIDDRRRKFCLSRDETLLEYICAKLG